jgi:hypothetical protein
MSHASTGFLNLGSGDVEYKAGEVPSEYRGNISDPTPEREPIEKNPHGENRKARRAAASDKRRDERRIRKLIKRLDAIGG